MVGYTASLCYRGLELKRSLPSDEDATFDAEVSLGATAPTRQVIWGTHSGQAVPLASACPIPRRWPIRKVEA